MVLEDSGLYKEISSILNLPKPPPVSYSAILHTEQNGKNISAIKVINLDNVRDFEMNYADSIMVTLLLPKGVYTNQIYPFQGDIDITIYRTPMTPDSENASNASYTSAIRYSASLVDMGDALTEGNYPGPSSQTALDLTNMIEVEFQLLDKSLEQLRMAAGGGSFRKKSSADILKMMMTDLSLNVKLPDQVKILGVDMVEPNTKIDRDQVIIPHGTKLVDLPMYVQNNCGGVYEGGMGYFLYNRFWHLFPIYDTTRMRTASKTLTIIRVPPDRYPMLDRTWKVEGSSVVILANTDAVFRGDSDSLQLTHGNGVRFADASVMMDNFSETDEKGVTMMSRGDTNTEFAAVKRKNGKNNIPVSATPITSNRMVELARLARRNGSVMAFAWQNSNPTLIVPGMPVRILYIANGQTLSKEGVVLKAQDSTRTNGNGILSQGHLTDSTVSVFLQ